LACPAGLEAVDDVRFGHVEEEGAVAVAE